MVKADGMAYMSVCKPALHTDIYLAGVRMFW